MNKTAGLRRSIISFPVLLLELRGWPRAWDVIAQSEPKAEAGRKCVRLVDGICGCAMILAAHFVSLAVKVETQPIEDLHRPFRPLSEGLEADGIAALALPCTS